MLKLIITRKNSHHWNNHFKTSHVKVNQMMCLIICAYNVISKHPMLKLINVSPPTWRHTEYISKHPMLKLILHHSYIKRLAVISKHPMLKLIIMRKRWQQWDIDFKTSHVKVNPFHTSFPECPSGHFKTSHVKVNR